MNLHEAPRLDHNAEPDPKELVSTDPRIRVVESRPDDEEVAQFLAENTAEFKLEGNIDVDVLLNKWVRHNAHLYKVTAPAIVERDVSGVEGRNLENEMMAGFVATINLGSSAEVVYALDRHFRGNGYMGSAVEAVTADLRRRHIEGVAKVNPENTASVKLLGRAGYRSFGIMDGSKKIFYSE